MGENKNLIEEWNHFCNTLDFGNSALDSRAIQFMNEFKVIFNEEIAQAKLEVINEIEEFIGVQMQMNTRYDKANILRLLEAYKLELKDK